MTSETTLFTQLHEYIHTWYDTLNEYHDRAMHEHVYAYLATITEFSDDTE